MNTYLLPVSDSKGPWIECVNARGIVDAENKFVKLFADIYDFIDYGDNFQGMKEIMENHSIQVGEIYDIEEF